MFTPCFGCPSSGWEQITTLGQGAVFVQDILMHLTPFSPGIKHCLFAVLQTQCLQTLGEQIPPQHASPQPDQVIGLTYCY